MARRDSAGVRLFTRNGNDFTARFPLAVAAITALPAHSFLIDGEAIVTDDKGLAVFELIRRARNGGAAVLCAFDLIELDGADLRRAPIEQRKHKLARLVRTPHPGIVINEHYDGDGDIVFKYACKLGCEGIVSKRLGSPYRSGAALRWRHVDLDRAQLSVTELAEQTRSGVRYKAPKTDKGRTVALPAMVVAELRAHRLRQAEALLRLGVRVADDTFVCAREDGEPQQPNSIGYACDRFLAATKLPRIRFHDLRHSHATAMLASNVHPKIVSERLGHSRITLTMDTYSHVIPGMQEEAAAAIDAAFGAALNKRI